MKVKNADMEKNLKEMNEKYHELNKLWQNAESMLVDATAEVKVMINKYKTLFYFISNFYFIYKIGRCIIIFYFNCLSLF